MSRNVRQITGWTGLAAALLFAAGNALWAFDQPAEGASPAEILAFYQDDSTRIIIGATISLISYIPFIIFASGLRAIIREWGDDDLLALSAFAGGVLAIGAGVAAEPINMIGAVRAADGNLTTSLGQAVFEISYVFGSTAAGVGAAILLFATAIAGLRSPVGIRRATSLLFIVIGIALLVPLGWLMLAVAVVLLGVCGVQILRSASAVEAVGLRSTSSG